MVSSFASARLLFCLFLPLLVQAADSDSLYKIVTIGEKESYLYEAHSWVVRDGDKAINLFVHRWMEDHAPKWNVELRANEEMWKEIKQLSAASTFEGRKDIFMVNPTTEDGKKFTEMMKPGFVLDLRVSP
eukprot:GHVS01041400.1.p1 GENE.GHVS01041400.1~~GHVS01041400.1.p1  ORF type:complete len:130 (+),score=18.81 GHVS01041400.1:187-576(+)